MIESSNNFAERPLFNLTEGGPGAAALRRLHLMSPGLGAGSARTAWVLAALAWTPLAVLSVLGGVAIGGTQIPFFKDIAAHVRFLVAVPVLMLAEKPIGIRLRELGRHFLDAGLVSAVELPRFASIVQKSVQMRDSRTAELSLLALTYVTTAYVFSISPAKDLKSTWRLPIPGRGISAAGYWYLLIALPIFQFLVYRWAYRMVIWMRYLGGIASLDLRLTPVHPDRAAGLGFLGKGLVPFGTILFALSAVAASVIAVQILFADAKLESFTYAYAALVIVALLIFVGPLLVFTPKLVRLKNEGCLLYGTLASRYTQLFDSKWVKPSEAATNREMMATGDFSSLANLGNSYEMMRRMRVVPIELPDLIAFALPGVIPVVPLLATVMPLANILKGLFRLIA